MPIAARLKEVKIRHLPLREPALVERGASVMEAVEAIKARQLGCALVCERGRLVGIFTERDLLNRVLDGPDRYSAPVERFMSPEPARLSPDDPIEAAMRLMHEGDYRNIPLVDGDGRAAGVVTVRDVITYFAERFPKEALNLPPDPDQRMEREEGG